MKVLVTGSAGHLGEALVRTLKKTGHEVIGTDLLPSDFTNRLDSITDRDHIKRCMVGIEAVLHTATLHKPHVATHSRQDFVDTNITGDAQSPGGGHRSRGTLLCLHQHHQRLRRGPDPSGWRSGCLGY